MQRTRVVAAVITRGENVLICQRPHHNRHGGLWEFPGGKCEEGESDFDTTCRELEEELAVRATEVGKAQFSSADAGSAFEIVFLPVIIEGEPTLHEHVDLRWVRYEDAATLELAPTDRRFVEFMLGNMRDPR